MNLNKHYWIIFCFLQMILLQGCLGERSSENTKTLRIQVNNQPDILNPALSGLSVSSYIESMMTLPLARRDDDNDGWIPVLVESFIPQVSQNGVEYPLILRPEARWSDGHRVTYTDLLYTIKMALNPFIAKQSWAAYLELISEVRVSNDTLFLSMDTPYILADEFIAGLSPYPAHVLDPDNWLDSMSFNQFKTRNFKASDEEKLQTLAKNFNTFGTPGHWPEPVAGLFHMINWAPEQSLTLTRVNEFWGNDLESVKRLFETNIDSLVYVIIPDPQNALNVFTSGEIDVLNTIDGRDSALISAFSGEIHDVPTLQLYYIAMNHQNPLLGQKYIRQALNMTINREDLVHRLFQGHGQPAYGPIHPAKPYYTSLPVSYDIEQARNILQNAGCTDTDNDGILECPVNGTSHKMTFHIWTTRSQLSRDVATLVKGYWRALGVELEIQSADFRSFLPDLQNKTYDLATLALRQNNILDDPFPLWHSSQTDPTGKNYQALTNDSIDQTLELLRESVKPDMQNKYYSQLQELFSEQVPVLFLVAPDDLVGVRADVDLKWSSQRPGYDLLRSKVNR